MRTLFLYQTGYLTIKRADEFGYILGYPNNEVRQSLYQVVLPALAMRAENEVFSIQSDPRTTVGIALELDELGKGVLGWKIVEY